jgi:heptose I phosphotransferase
MIWIERHLAEVIADGKPGIKQVFAIQGEIYREPSGAGRRTLRFERSGVGYFLKLHWGVGWREIFKNLVSLRLPVLGARNEWQAIRRLEQIGVETMHLAGFGEEGWNPARRRSFVITRELRDTVSLEDYCRDWPERPPPPALKRALIRRVAEMTARLHDHGVNHRDLYICHFLLQLPWSGPPQELHLYLIDLHRVQMRRAVPQRWRVKDLAALYFSALHIGLTRRDLYRFIRWYARSSLSDALRGSGALWRRVERRALWLERYKPVSGMAPETRSMVLADGRVVECGRILRSLPGRRHVCEGYLDGRRVVVKVFLDPARAQVHFQREADGLAAFDRAGVAAPEVLYAGRDHEARPVIVLAWIEHAQALSGCLRESDPAQRLRLMRGMVELIARHHAAGIRQTDLHLDNFLLADGRIHCLDGDAVLAQEGALDERHSLQNLALFFSQLSPDRDPESIGLSAYYAQLRSWAESAVCRPMSGLIDSARMYRWRKLRSKIYRDCTAVAHHRGPTQECLAARSAGASLDALLGDLDASCPADPEQRLKNGNTATVWRAGLDDRQVVVKRYNVKGRLHGVGRAIRESRASISWRNAHMLRMFGISTPEPLAFCMRREGPLRRVGYFLADEIGGENLFEWVGKHRDEPAELRRVAALVARLFAQLERMRITHGDMKASNLILTDDGLFLIDLDAMRQHRFRAGFDRAWRRDMARFAANWRDMPGVQEIMLEKTESVATA